MSYRIVPYLLYEMRKMTEELIILIVVCSLSFKFIKVSLSLLIELKSQSLNSFENRKKPLTAKIT